MNFTTEHTHLNKYTKNFINSINQNWAYFNIFLIVVVNPSLVFICIKKIKEIRNDKNNLSYCILSVLMIYWLIITIVMNTLISAEIVAYYEFQEKGVHSFILWSIGKLFDFQTFFYYMIATT